jgi:hypothetical protein
MTYSIADYKDRYANQIAEAGATTDEEVVQAIKRALYLSRVATPQDFEKFHETFKDYDHGLGSWKKWGGGNKMGSAGASITAARKARAEANAASRGPGLGFHLGQMARDVTARFSPTQGKGIATGAEGMGYSNHSRKNSYNTHGVGTRSDGSRGPVSSSSSPRSRRFAMSFSVPSNLQSLYSGSFNIAGGPDPNRGLNRGATYGRDGEKTSITTDSDFGIRMRNQVLADMARFKA